MAELPLVASDALDVLDAAAVVVWQQQVDETADASVGVEAAVAFAAW